MSRIFKYDLEPDRRQVIMMHESAQPIRICEQNGLLKLYAIVDTDSEVIPRIFVVISTGANFELRGKTYIGAATLGGWYEAFVFEQDKGWSDEIDHRHDDDLRELKDQLSES